jgi:choline transport protein
LLLYRRCTGAIAPSNTALSSLTSQANNSSHIYAIWGPWKVPGIFGVANNAFACAYLLFVFFFSFWPTYKKVEPATMNWSVLVTGTIAGVSALYYVVAARKTYRGPVVEITL